MKSSQRKSKKTIQFSSDMLELAPARSKFSLGCARKDLTQYQLYIPPLILHTFEQTITHTNESDKDEPAGVLAKSTETQTELQYLFFDLQSATSMNSQLCCQLSSIVEVARYYRRGRPAAEKHNAM